MRRPTIRFHAPTAGTRIAIWMFPLVTLYLGLAYLGPTSRLTAPSYVAAKGIMPMHAWGVLFIGLAGFKLVCILRGTTRGYVVAMCAGMGLYATWAVMFFGSIFADSSASLAGPAWPLAWVAAHVATLATLTEKRK